MTDEQSRTRDEGGVPINFAGGPPWTTKTRIPRSVWAKIKRAGHCVYWSRDDLEDFDDNFWAASGEWRYQTQALQTVLDAGMRVTVNGVEIGHTSEIAAAQEEARRKREERLKREKEEAEERKALLVELNALFEGAEYPATCEEVENAGAILLPGDRKKDIYGGGSWHHLTDTHLWRVVNNGMDGDDWSRNNYRTQGAGAIARRVPRTSEVDDLLCRIDEYKSKLREQTARGIQ